MRRHLLRLERATRELREKFPPPPTAPPDTVERLVEDFGWALNLIVLYHHEGWSDTNDRLEEVLRSVGMPEILKWNFNLPGVADAFSKEFHEKTMIALRALVEKRKGKRPNDETNTPLTVELEPLYSEIPTKLKNEYRLPTEFAEFYRRAAALFKDKPLQ